MESAALIARQREFFQSGVTLEEKFRRGQLCALRDAMIAREDSLLAALHADLRKSPHEAYAAEIGWVLGEIREALRDLHAWMKPQRRKPPMLAWPASAWVQPEPFGVALIIGPWNYPLQLLFTPLVSAIAAGNCAVLKPSEHAPHTARAVAELVRETFPPHFIAVAEGGQDVAEALLREKTDTIFFTGSTRIGRAVMTAAARHLTPVTLELGGRSPCIVCADAPVDVTARRIVWGKFMNAGQTCVAPDHVWVERSAEPALLAALARAIRAFYGENPQQSADYGRIIHRGHFERLRGLLDDGGIAHGGRHDAADLFIEPTLLTEVPPDAAVLGEEIFGPILPVLPFDQLDDVLASLRAAPTPLALYLFTADRAIQRRVLAATRSGGVCLNDTLSHILSRDLPFGGLGESGMGTCHGRAGFDAFSHPRSVLRRPLTGDPSFRYPPPRASLALLKRLLRWFG